MHICKYMDTKIRMYVLHTYFHKHRYIYIEFDFISSGRADARSGAKAVFQDLLCPIVMLV
jgi:hypothetical protein